MVEVVRRHRVVSFEEIKDGEFFLFCNDLYFKSSFYSKENSDYYNAYCFEVDDNHYTFFEEDDDVEPVGVKIVVIEGYHD